MKKIICNNTLEVCQRNKSFINFEASLMYFITLQMTSLAQLMGLNINFLCYWFHQFSKQITIQTIFATIHIKNSTLVSTYISYNVCNIIISTMDIFKNKIYFRHISSLCCCGCSFIFISFSYGISSIDAVEKVEYIIIE